MSGYLVEAYRWGKWNLHHYKVWGGESLEVARGAASKEAENKSGKYAIVIWKVDGFKFEPVGYFPSREAETGLRDDKAIIADAVKLGQVRYKVKTKDWDGLARMFE